MAMATLPQSATAGGRAPREARLDPARRRSLKPRKSWTLTALMSVLFVYSMLPLFWLVVSSTKTQGALVSSFGLWFSGPFAFWDNVVQVFTYQDGTFGRWVLNTILYTVVGACG